MKIIDDRSKELRASVQLSQTRIAKMFGTAQSGKEESDKSISGSRYFYHHAWQRILAVPSVDIRKAKEAAAWMLCIAATAFYI